MTKDRLEAFSDGVFGVAITLLVLNVKIPDKENISNQQLNIYLKNAAPNILTFIFTFLVVGVFWVAHRRIFSFVKAVDANLLWLNIFYLMFNTLIPFPASILARHPFLQTSILFYSSTLLIIGSFHFIFLLYISRHMHLKQKFLTPGVYRTAARLSVVGPICYLMAAIASFINIYASFVFIGTALIYYIFFAGKAGLNAKRQSMPVSPLK